MAPIEIRWLKSAQSPSYKRPSRVCLPESESLLRVVGLMLLFVLAVISVVASVSDARRRVIPNEACLIVAAAGLAFQAVRTWMPHAIELLVLTGSMANLLPSPLVCMVSAAAVVVVGAAVESAHRRIRGKQGMGMGDVKFVGAWACTLGWLVVPALAVACLPGAVVALIRRHRTFAMAPWLSLAFLGVGTALTVVGYLS